MTFEVVLTDEAGSNLRDIADWIASRSPQGASAWLDAFDGAKRRLTEMPMSCGRAPEDEHCELELRQAFFKTRKGRVYRAVFYIEESTVVITHVRGPRQRLIPGSEFPQDQ